MTAAGIRYAVQSAFYEFQRWVLLLTTLIFCWYTEIAIITVSSSRESHKVISYQFSSSSCWTNISPKRICWSTAHLNHYFTAQRPDVRIVQHYGGRSGLLRSEIYEAIKNSANVS